MVRDEMGVWGGGEGVRRVEDGEGREGGCGEEGEWVKRMREEEI